MSAEKYASWLAATSGQAIVLFVDYETFGEHHWPESGIHEFLRWLPGEVIKYEHLNWCTPSEIIRRHDPVGEIDVDEFNTVSWADLERDTTAWIDNPMQTMCYDSLKALEQPVKAIGDQELLRLWRYLQMSDHLYYMSVKGGGPGDVHSYFNPCSSPIEAFTVYSKIISDIEVRILRELEKPEHTAKRLLRRLPVGKGFTFFHDFARPTEITVQSLDEFHSALETVDAKVLRFHVERWDFVRWLRQIVGDEKLADKMAEVLKKGLSGEKLRRRVLKVVEGRVRELRKTSHPYTRS